jgi:ribosomal protein S18 acetylase RimI-like enzyme
MTADRTALIEFSDDWLDELIPMWRASFEDGVGITDPHPLDAQRRYFMSEVLPRHAVRLAIEDGRLIGFVAASRESIAQLYVRIGFQGRGIGTRLLEWAKAESAGKLWLFTFRRNLRACSFYEKHGFVAVAYGFEPFWQLEDVKYAWPG